MIANYATAEDFTWWEFSARDARAAAKAMRGWNPIAEGRYDDEASTYGMELARRRAS